MPAADESVLRVAIDHLLEGVQVIGFDWRYLYLNDTAARHGQRSVAELVGRTMIEAYPGIEHTELFVALGRVMRERRSERLVNEFQYPTGERRWFELFVEPVPDGICVLSLDVTDRRRAEEQLLRAQKMEAIGQLAGGVAHDFNNVLTAILGYADLLASQIGPDKPIGRDLREIVAAAERAAALTRQLLAFSRDPAAPPRAVSLSSLVEGLEPMLRRLIPENIRIEKRLASGRAVRADPTQLEQILVNVVVNARDAMPRGGVLGIEVRDEPATGPGPSDPAGAQRVALTVRDTGVGMTPDVQARIFEPFFTTKPSGRGTGLGLAGVSSIVSKLGGSIEVESEPGKGTSFVITLPACGDRPDAVTVPSREAPPVGRERILLVEDEPGVRSFAAAVLRRHGYAVHEAEAAEQALAEMDRTAGGMDVLITDIVLPGMSGPELAAHARGRWPDVCVLFMSGHLDAGLPPAGSRARLLEKPFNARTLLSHLREVLESRRGNAPQA